MKPNLWCSHLDGEEYGTADNAFKLAISDEDRAKFDAIGHKDGETTVRVTDIPSGKQYDVRRTECGLGCFCACQADTV